MREIQARLFTADGEKFSTETFASQIGKLVDVTFGGVELGAGLLTDVIVEEDGRSAWLTVKLPDSTPNSG